MDITVMNANNVIMPGEVHDTSTLWKDTILASLKGMFY